MFQFFYNFFKTTFADGLYSKFAEQGNPPSPPGFSYLVNNAGDPLINNEHVYLVGTDNG